MERTLGAGAGRNVVIASLHGTLKRKLADRLVLEVGGVGYEVFLPQFVMRTLSDHPEGEELDLEIYYHVTDRQLRPTLIGFSNAVEKRFFEKFISVEDIGPQKAARAMVFSVSTIAQAIESDNVELLRQLPGVGERTARKMVATLRGKVMEEALLRDEGFGVLAEAQPTAGITPATELRNDVVEVLVGLGHRRPEAATKVDAALKRHPSVETVDELIREVYRGERVPEPVP